MNHVLNFGSLNVDHVYQVTHFVQPGETLPSSEYQRFAGGKGFNQSIALARAGLRVTHAGQLGSDGAWLRERLQGEGIDVGAVQTSCDVATGHAIIQVAKDGQNSILTYGGANQTLDGKFVQRVFDKVQDVDLVLLQNETSVTGQVLAEAKRRGLPVAFNPAPMTSEVVSLPLENSAILIVNESEAIELLGNGDPPTLCQRLVQRFPASLGVLTAGKRGSWAARADEQWHDPGRSVKAVDTTAAGDTFIGFFIAELLRGDSVSNAIAIANQAAAIAVTRSGSADSIPTRDDLPQR